MKRKFILFALAISVLISLKYSGGPASFAGEGFVGAPGESGTLCSTCHSAGAFGIPSTILSITDAMGTPVTSYTGGQTYQVSLTAFPGTGTPSAYGFQMTVLDGADADVANFVNPASNVKVSNAINVAGGRTYAEHSGGASANNNFTFDWIAPDQGTGGLTFYYNVNLVNLNGGTSGDSGGSGFTTSFAESMPSVHVQGALVVNDAFTFPTVDGSAEQVLTTDGAGNVSWMDAVSAFSGTNISNYRYNSSIPSNIEFKQQKEEIENLRTEVELLKSEIVALKKLIEKWVKK